MFMFIMARPHHALMSDRLKQRIEGENGATVCGRRAFIFRIADWQGRRDFQRCFYCGVDLSSTPLMNEFKLALVEPKPELCGEFVQYFADLPHVEVVLGCVYNLHEF